MPQRRRPVIAVYGGSFNPPHDGHFEVCTYIRDALGADRVILPFANNPFKDPASYAPLAHRIAMARLMAASYPDLPLEFSDIEARIGSNRTWDVLSVIKQENPEADIIWVMGSDCLAHFHKWENAAGILATTRVAVLARPGYTHLVDDNPMASMPQAHRHETVSGFMAAKTGWLYLPDNPQHEVSSSAILAAARAGTLVPTRAFAPVLAYMRRNGLYGLAATQGQKPQPSMN